MRATPGNGGTEPTGAQWTPSPKSSQIKTQGGGSPGSSPKQPQRTVSAVGTTPANSRPQSIWGSNLRVNRTQSISTGISIGQSRKSFSPQLKAHNSNLVSSARTGSRAPFTTATATSNIGSKSSRLAFSARQPLEATANAPASNECDDDDGYDSDYEEEKDKLILKLKAEAGKLENELMAIRRKIEVERAKISTGTGAGRIPATTAAPPVIVHAETQTDMFDVIKPTRPPPQPQAEPPPLPQSLPPPLPQSLTPQLLTSSDKPSMIKILFNVPQEFANKVPPNWKLAKEYVKEFPDTYTLDDILVSYWNNAPISIGDKIMFNKFIDFLVGENYSIPYVFSNNDKKIILPFFKIFASIDKDMDFLKVVIDEEIEKARIYKEIFDTNGVLYWALSAFVQVRCKKFIIRLLNENLDYLMKKDSRVDLGSNAQELMFLTIVSALTKAFTYIQKLIPTELVAIGNYIWKTGSLKFCDLKPQYVGGFMFDRVIRPVFNAPEKFGLLASRAPNFEKMVNIIINSLKISANVLVYVCDPSSVTTIPVSEIKYTEIFKRIPENNVNDIETVELDNATLSQKDSENLLRFIQESIKESVAGFQREVVQRVARGEAQRTEYVGSIIDMFQAYLASEEFAEDAANPAYNKVLTDDDVRESPTPFLNIQGHDALSERDIAGHPFTRVIMQYSTMCLHPRYRYHLRVHGTDHYITEDPEYARAPLGEWKIVALHRRESSGSANNDDDDDAVCLHLELAGDSEYAADRKGAAKVKRITGSEYSWSSFNDEAYTFSRMLYRATPHVDRPYPVSQLHFAPSLPMEKLLPTKPFVVTIIHPSEGASKMLPVPVQTTVKELFEAVSRKFVGYKSPAMDDTSKFALKVCGIELYLFATNDLPLLQAPRLARAVRRGKRIAFVIVPADDLVVESPVPIDLELPRAPAPGADGVVPSSSVAAPFEIVIASGTIPLERQCPPHLRVEAAIYYGGRPLSSYFVTHAELPVLSDRRAYVWNSKISFDILIPYLPRESRVCIAVFSVPKSAVDADPTASGTSGSPATKSSKSLLELVPATVLFNPVTNTPNALNSGVGGNVGTPTGAPGIGAGGGNGIGNGGNDRDSGTVTMTPLAIGPERNGNGGILIDSAGSSTANGGNTVVVSGGAGNSDGISEDVNGGVGGNGSAIASVGNDGSDGGANLEDDSDSEDEDEEISCVRPVYWTSFPIYNYRSMLISGQHSLQMLKGKVNPIGICVHAMNLHENANLRVEIPMDVPVVYSEEDCGDDPDAEAAIEAQRKEAENEIVTLEVMTKLDKLIMTDSLYNLNEAEKALLWKYRYYLKTKPQSIIKLMLALPSTDYHISKEIHSMLKDWAPIDPIRALELLDGKYPDTYIREYAVGCLSKMSVDELDDYMMQLVQALKFETYHNSSLAIFMLKAAINNRLPIGHTLFLNLKAEMHIPEVRERFLLLLKCYLRACGEHCDILARQLDLIDTLMEVNKSKSFQRLESFAVGTRFYLPHDPTLCVSRIIVEKCRVLGSARAPLWLAFENADKMAKDPVCVLFKAADDLRQDMLALQVIKLMDRIWEADGLDMGLTLYKCVALGPAVGMIELVPSCTTMADIQKLMGGGVTSAFKEKTIAEWLKKKNPDPNMFKNVVVSNFIHSLAGYCVATYLIGVGDRHNDNIMITTDGHFFHIDFGHILGNAEKWKGFKRDRAPFVLTPELVYVMGGRGDENFGRFCTLAEDAYAAIRKHHYLFITLFTMMLSTDIPELRSEEDVYYLKSAFNTEKDEAGAKDFFKGLIAQSLGTKMTRINNAIHIAVHSHINDAHDVNLN